MVVVAGERGGVLVGRVRCAWVIVFAVMEILPGDAAKAMLGPTATPETVAALSHKLGLDQPAPLRYLHWIGGALRGDFGLSYAYGSPVGPPIAPRLAGSAALAPLSLGAPAAPRLPPRAAAPPPP